MFVKLYATALIKKQWGQNLIKFRGTKLLVELNSMVEKYTMMQSEK